jgi:adenylate cyclase, class 2
MAVEIEAKMKVPSLEVVRAKLEAAKAERVGDFFETNIFFDTEDRSLLAADQGLRLRINRNLELRDESYLFTFKGPRQHGKLKSREEIELDVANPRDAERFLNALGYVKVLAFEKRRHSWKMNGCSVELDELPHLGVYVEIEGPDENAIMKVRESLGLAKTPIIKTSYIAMLMAWLQEKGSADRTVVFSKSA